MMFAKFNAASGFFEFSTRNNGGVELSSSAYDALHAGQALGQIIVADAGGYPYLADRPPATQAEVIAQYENLLDAHLDSVARLHRYRDREMFALRSGYEGPYQREGIAFAQWMDNCNVQAYALLNAVLNGSAEIPTPESFVAGLPEFIKP